MKFISNCPVCNSNDFSPFIECKDFTVSKLRFKITSCNSCNFKFTNPRPDDSEIGEYYKSDKYISHSNTNKGLVAKLYHLVRNHTLKGKTKLLDRYVSRGTILDYGCGIGMFLKICYKLEWEVFGVEPDDTARKVETELDLNIYKNKDHLKKGIGNRKFDAITLWHALEHLSDLHESLIFFRDHIKNDGVIVVAVPNYHSYDSQFYKENWAAYDLPRHLYHFDLDSIKRLFSKSGFNLIETLPMKFDSFYVSMLSEKYKTGSVNYLKAFIIGLKSNFKARSSNNYSSLIYVLKPC